MSYPRAVHWDSDKVESQNLSEIVWNKVKARSKQVQLWIYVGRTALCLLNATRHCLDYVERYSHYWTNFTDISVGRIESNKASMILWAQDSGDKLADWMLWWIRTQSYSHQMTTSLQFWWFVSCFWRVDSCLSKNSENQSTHSSQDVRK